MITKQREVTVKDEDIIQSIAMQSCDMGRLGFEFYDYIMHGYKITLLFRKTAEPQ
jgi:hypothetical protein